MAVPKNTNVIVKRVPAGRGPGLLARLQTGGKPSSRPQCVAYPLSPQLLSCAPRACSASLVPLAGLCGGVWPRDRSHLLLAHGSSAAPRPSHKRVASNHGRRRLRAAPACPPARAPAPISILAVRTHRDSAQRGGFVFAPLASLLWFKHGCRPAPPTRTKPPQPRRRDETRLCARRPDRRRLVVSLRSSSRRVHVRRVSHTHTHHTRSRAPGGAALRSRVAPAARPTFEAERVQLVRHLRRTGVGVHSLPPSRPPLSNHRPTAAPTKTLKSNERASALRGDTREHDPRPLNHDT